MSGRRFYVISVAAELAGMHPQTLRQYDREGLVQPVRTQGGGRRYTDENVQQLLEVQRLSQQEGLNLAGIRRILTLQAEVVELLRRNEQLRHENDALRQARGRVFAAGPAGEIVTVAQGRRPQRRQSSTALVVWRPSS